LLVSSEVTFHASCPLTYEDDVSIRVLTDAVRVDYFQIAWCCCDWVLGRCHHRCYRNAAVPDVWHWLPELLLCYTVISFHSRLPFVVTAPLLTMSASQSCTSC